MFRFMLLFAIALAVAIGSIGRQCQRQRDDNHSEPLLLGGENGAMVCDSV
jgi:hypothetical protein